MGILVVEPCHVELKRQCAPIALVVGEDLVKIEAPKTLRSRFPLVGRYVDSGTEIQGPTQIVGQT